MHVPATSSEPVCPYDSPADALRHQAQMEHIAGQLGRPLAEVRILYEQLLGQLRVDARVKDFLPTIVGKHLRDLLRRQAGW